MTWEIVHDNGHGDFTERMKVPGGWIYRSTVVPQHWPTGPLAVTMAFVPDNRKGADDAA